MLIFLLKIYKFPAKKNNKGFTLLEILIALTLLMGVLVMSASLIKKKDNSLKKTFRQFISLNRQLDHSSRLKRTKYRLVIQLDKTKKSWWVEKQSSPEKNNSFSQNFVLDTDFYKKPQHLPYNLSFDSVELSELKQVITKGKAYIYYFPEGQFNLALINLKTDKKYWAFFINRVTGELTVFNTKKELQELKQ